MKTKQNNFTAEQIQKINIRFDEYSNRIFEITEGLENIVTLMTSLSEFVKQHDEQIIDLNKELHELKKELMPI